MNMNTSESILDAPRPGLCGDVWRMDESGEYALTPEAETKIGAFVRFMKLKFGMPDSVRVRLVGSLMSNSYSDSSDIDVHFSSEQVKKNKLDRLNTLMRKASDQYSAAYPDMMSVAGHPIQAYFLDNVNHDLTSVGCYDFGLGKWLVGPELRDQSFDPYMKYFEKDMKRLSGIIEKARRAIFETYELSLVLLKSSNPEFKSRQSAKLMSSLRRGCRIYEDLRKSRSFKAKAVSPETAGKIRKSEEWAVSDSSFKLMGKFGYIGQLKAMSRCLEDIEENGLDCGEAARRIVEAFSENISSKNINDSELFVDESIRGMLSQAALASLLAIPGLTSLPVLAGQLKTAKLECAQAGQPFNSRAKQVKNAITASQKNDRRFGDLSMSNTVNAVAMVLWHETRGEGEAGQKAVLSVIMNRCGKDFDRIPDVLRQRGQFTCVKNLYRGGWTDKTYAYFTPDAAEIRNPESMATWKYLQKLAVDMLNGKFKSTIGRRNAYLNPDTADKSAVNSWGQKLDLKIENHKFGYLPEYDGTIMVPGTMLTKKRAAKMAQDKAKVITVKPGDQLAKIAKQNHTTVKKILELNPEIKNPN